MAEPGAAGESHFFLAYNRNKKSLALDVRTPEGKEVVLDLLADADVVVENFRVGVMKRFGLDYASLAERFPRLVYVSVSAYGQDGPMADRPGFDPVLQAEFGMMSLTGEPEGRPHAPPALAHRHDDGTLCGRLRQRGPARAPRHGPGPVCRARARRCRRCRARQCGPLLSLQRGAAAAHGQQPYHLDAHQPVPRGRRPALYGSRHLPAVRPVVPRRAGPARPARRPALRLTGRAAGTPPGAVRPAERNLRLGAPRPLARENAPPAGRARADYRGGARIGGGRPSRHGAHHRAPLRRADPHSGFPDPFQRHAGQGRFRAAAAPRQRHRSRAARARLRRRPESPHCAKTGPLGRH